MDTDPTPKNKVKNGGDKKVTIYYKKEFVYARQVLKEYNIMRY